MEIGGRTLSQDRRSSGHRKRLYRPQDADSLGYQRDLGNPGDFPFTRGIYPAMYRDRLWTMRQYAGYATAEDSNRRYRYLLSQGTTGLSVAFDLPTQLGLDSDHPLAQAEVGRSGVAIDSIEDMCRLFEGIPLGSVSTSMTINATATILFALYLVAARRQGVPWTSLRGTVQNDILKEYLARGTYIFPPSASVRLATDLVAFGYQEVPQWNPISISGYHIREAGATAAQEIGFTLANAETYVESALSTGLEIDQFAPRLSFFFGAHNDLFEEVAKFRAARRLWARLVKERWKAKDPRSAMLRFHTQTAGSALTAQQPDNNVVRVAVQALAAVLGGTQSLHTNGKDEALALPTEQTARLALRTQQILAHESGITESADPLGGSWYVERLTSDLEEEAQGYLTRIRSMGGMLKAIESGFVSQQIQESAYQYQKRLESGDQAVVGVNHLRDDEPYPLETHKIDPKSEPRQIESLVRFRAARDGSQVDRSLEHIQATAETEENLIPAIISAVEAGTTVGEISDSLANVFGKHVENVTL